jgi:hypothetical protein
VIDELVKALADFQPQTLIGKTKQHERDQIVDLFNRTDNQFRLIIANKTVGGVSINLHDTEGHFPRYTFLNPGYQINELQQAVERTDRLGSKSRATIRFVYGLSGITELSILNSLSKKGEVMQGILSDQGTIFPGGYDNNFEADPRALYGPEFFNRIPGLDKVSNFVAGIQITQRPDTSLEEDLARVALEEREPEEDEEV